MLHIQHVRHILIQLVGWGGEEGVPGSGSTFTAMRHRLPYWSNGYGSNGIGSNGSNGSNASNWSNWSTSIIQARANAEVE